MGMCSVFINALKGTSLEGCNVAFANFLLFVFIYFGFLLISKETLGNKVYPSILSELL